VVEHGIHKAGKLRLQKHRAAVECQSDRNARRAIFVERREAVVSGKNILWTFIIGLIAGIAPFLFMQLLPALLNPTQLLMLPNCLAILLTGTLVGVTTAIIFAKTFDTRDPQEVFVYALGVPAILIATVSNLSTISEAKFTATRARIAASNAILNVAPRPVHQRSRSVESYGDPPPPTVEY
jgi:hypothetical protein